MACCLIAPRHYLNQCWPIIRQVFWHSHESNLTGNAHDIYHWCEFKNDWLKVIALSPRGQWISFIYMFATVLWQIGDIKGGIRSMAEVRNNWLTRPDHLVRAARHYERGAQILIRHAVMSAREVSCIHTFLMMSYTLKSLFFSSATDIVSRAYVMPSRPSSISPLSIL